MNTIKQGLIIGLAILVGITSANVFGGTKEPSVGGIADANCFVTTSTLAVVGHQESKVILATSSNNRAWARIQVPNSATNTMFINLDEGASATTASPVALNTANTNGASSTPVLELGGERPYQGAVSGLTNFGSTTALITECTY